MEIWIWNHPPPPAAGTNEVPGLEDLQTGLVVKSPEKREKNPQNILMVEKKGVSTPDICDFGVNSKCWKAKKNDLKNSPPPPPPHPPACGTLEIPGLEERIIGTVVKSMETSIELKPTVAVIDDKLDLDVIDKSGMIVKSPKELMKLDHPPAARMKKWTKMRN